MNATIEKIVGLLFEDIEETEETLAIREEILTNCQERYADMLESGMSEDDAIHAVIESLNGMEEMLADYPRKQVQEAPVPAPAVETPEEPHWTFDPAQSPIHEIRVLRMGSTDVNVETSNDGLLHVICEGENATLITGIDEGVLSIALIDQKQKHKVKMEAEFSFDLSDLGGLFEKLAKRFVAMTASCLVRICIPQSIAPALKVNTASGDVEVDAVALESLTIGAASGDITLSAVAARDFMRLHTASGDISGEDVRAGEMHINTASGDVNLRDVSVDGPVRMNTASGDAEWSGESRSLDVNTASGDLRLEGAFVSVSFRSVSGDVDVLARGEGLESLKGVTSSGDQRVILPAGADLCVNCRTSSGDIRQHCPTRPEGTVRVELQSSSGDISVR